MQGDRPDACEVARAPKVQIEFHYQTGDTSVKKYFVEELYPSYRDIEEIIDLEIVPFGQTEVVRGDDGNYTFTCPNGPNECIGNKIHVSLTNVMQMELTLNCCQQRPVSTTTTGITTTTPSVTILTTTENYRHWTSLSVISQTRTGQMTRTLRPNSALTKSLSTCGQQSTSASEAD